MCKTSQGKLQLLFFSLYMYVSVFVCVCVYNINDSEEVRSTIFGC